MNCLLGSSGNMASALPAAYLQELETEVRHRQEARLKRVHDAGLEADMLIVHGVPFQRSIDAGTRAASRPYHYGHLRPDRSISRAHGECGREGGTPGPVLSIGHEGAFQHRCSQGRSPSAVYKKYAFMTY